MDLTAILKRLCQASGVSGYESEVGDIVAQEFSKYADEVRVDRLGSVVALKRGQGGRAPAFRVMLAGHMDEIGLIITKIEEGFLHFSSVGGFDDRVLLGQEVVVHGRRALPGIIGSRPPHVLPPEERSKVIEMDKLFIDVGLSKAEVEELVQVGDLVTISRQVGELKNDLVTGKALDDRTAVVAILACLERLTTLKHTWDVYAVATVQEEVSFGGAITSTYDLLPHLGLAIDVTHADMPGLANREETKAINQGPAIALGPNFHPGLHDRLVQLAREQEILHQIEPIPGRSGTDAWPMQVSREGLPTALLSIPLRYMHTSVETVSVKDIERTGRLLAAFIGHLDDEFMNSLKEAGAPTETKEH